MLTVTDLIFFTGLAMWIAGVIGMSSASTFYGDDSRNWFTVSVLFAWLIVAGTIIYKAVGW